MTEYANYIITAIGLLGFWLAGKKVWWCWYINIFNQILWFIYGVATEQWGFVVGTFFYTFVFVKNAYSWTKEHYGWENWKRALPGQMLKPLGEIKTIEDDETGLKVHGTIYDEVRVNDLAFSKDSLKEVRADAPQKSAEELDEILRTRYQELHLRCPFKVEIEGTIYECINPKGCGGNHTIKPPWSDTSFSVLDGAMSPGGEGTVRVLDAGGVFKAAREVLDANRVKIETTSYDFTNITMDDIRRIIDEVIGDGGGQRIKEEEPEVEQFRYCQSQRLVDGQMRYCWRPLHSDDMHETWGRKKYENTKRYFWSSDSPAVQIQDWEGPIPKRGRE